MDRQDLLRILKAVAGGQSSPESALRDLVDYPTADMGFAQLDMHRRVRRGIPETVFGQGKTVEQVEQIVARMRAADSPVLVTRIDPVAAERICRQQPEARHDALARTLTIGSMPPAKARPLLVAAAGTSDLPVAQEAANTAAFLGHRVVSAYDVGVAGLHRLAAHREDLIDAGVIIAVAGMEGALPGVIAGMVSAPVIGVATSVGYGVSLGGLTPLFTMLTTCACGVTVVNVDNGYGAAVAAHLILSAVSAGAGTSGG